MGGFSTGVAVAVQPADGKILVGGYDESLTRSAVVARYTSTGALDPSFGSGGVVTTQIGDSGRISAMKLQNDGKIVIAGTLVRSGTGSDFVLIRLLSSGGLDTTFGEIHVGSFTIPNPTGSVTTDFGGQDEAHAIVIQGDGKIIAAGFAQPISDSSVAIARYNPDGSLDTTFGSGGRVTTNFVANDHGSGLFGALFDIALPVDPQMGDAALAIALQLDGKLVVVGRAETNNTDPNTPVTDIALARYNTNGTLDTTFGTGGKVTTAFDPTDPYAYDQGLAVVVQPDGRIVVAGFTGEASFEKFAVARYNTNGSLDTTFNSDGLVTTDNRGHIAYAIGIQQLLLAGKLIVAGEGNSSFSLARFDAYTTQITRVGTFALAPAESTVAAGQRFDYAFTWTVPEPENWHDLVLLQLRIRDASGTVLSAIFNQASNSFNLLNTATGQAEPGAAPGSNRVLETSRATLYMADARVVASGPTSPTVTLILPLSLKPQTNRRTFDVEVDAVDTFGNESGFVQAGTLSVLPSK